jgi:hypothetical protein
VGTAYASVTFDFLSSRPQHPYLLQLFSSATQILLHVNPGLGPRVSEGDNQRSVRCQKISEIEG